MNTQELKLEGGTAVITGAASGIGLELAKQAMLFKMNVVLADIDEEGLQRALFELPDGNSKTLIVKTDVSSDADIAKLCEMTYEHFGSLELLCNNAGVCLNRLSWEYTHQDWDWIMSVNLFSVSNAIRHFVPRMLKQNTRSHILNTASAAGLISTTGMSAYNASKHAVVTLSETLHQEFLDLNAPIGVSILCPARIPTKIHESSRNRPERYGPNDSPMSENARVYEQRMEDAVKSGKLSSQQVAKMSFEGILNKQLYILPHQKITSLIEQRFLKMIEH